MWAVAPMDKWQYIIWCCWGICDNFHACRRGKIKISYYFAVPFWAMSMSGIVTSLVNKSHQYQGSSAKLLSRRQNLQPFPMASATSLWVSLWQNLALGSLEGDGHPSTSLWKHHLPLGNGPVFRNSQDNRSTWLTSACCTGTSTELPSSISINPPSHKTQFGLQNSSLPLLPSPLSLPPQHTHARFLFLKQTIFRFKSEFSVEAGKRQCRLSPYLLLSAAACTHNKLWV